MSEPKESWINAFKLWQRNKPNGRLPTPTEIEELIEVATTRGLLVEELKAKLELEQRVSKVLVEALEKIVPEPPGCDSSWYAKQALTEAEKLREELIEVATTRGLLVEELKAKLELEQRVNKVLVEALKAECPCINNYPDGICRCEIYQTLAEAEKLREE